MIRPGRTTITIIAAFVILAASSLLPAQSRKQVSISGPRTVGQGVAGRSQSYFRQYSAGVGSLTPSRPLDHGALYTSMSAGRGSTLSTSIQQQQYNPRAAPVSPIGSSTSTIRRSPAGQPSGTGVTQLPGPAVGPARTSRSSHTYSPTIQSPAYLQDTTGLPFPTAPANLIADYDVTDPRVTILRQLSATRSTMSHVTALTGIDSQPTRPAAQGVEITTLAPTQPGLTRKLILAGEQFFRDGKYREAEASFASAVDISGRSTEAVLSLSRARFALRQYDLAGMNLAEALLAMPELPLTGIEPQRFYGDPDMYRQHLDSLVEMVDAAPWQPHQNLLLAYHLFRSGDDKQIREPLARALALVQPSRDEDLADAILILWDGLAANNTVQGDLTPAELPAEQKPSGLETPETSSEAVGGS
jgi:hypothetical protein